MRFATAGIFGVVFGIGVAAGTSLTVSGTAQPAPVAECGAMSTPQLRTTLYFGLARPKGAAVSELEWQLFLRDEVTTRFPEGLTVWEAEGQWRRADGIVDHERSKVLLLVHADDAASRTAVRGLIDRYRQKFDQQSVLWETARVCATS